MDGGEVVSVGTHSDMFLVCRSPIDNKERVECTHRVIQHLWTKADGHLEVENKFCELGFAELDT